MERHSQGTQAGSQDGQWSPQVPGVTNIGNGESRHRPWTELQQRLERVPSGPRNSGGGGSGSGSARRGMHGPGRAIPEAQAPDPRVLGDTARIRRSPWDMWGPGGHRTAGHPRAVQVSAPHARSIQAPTDWGLQELLRELTLGLKSWPPPVLLFLPYVTLCLGWSGATREHGSHRINSSQVAMPLAGAGAAP